MSHDDPSISARGPAILRLPPILSFLRSHPNLQVIHLAGCQLSSSQLGFALGSLADAGVRLRVLSVEVSSRLAQGFEDVVVNRLRCLVECARTMGGSLECVRLFGEHAEFSAKTLHEDLVSPRFRLVTKDQFDNRVSSRRTLYRRWRL